MNKSKCLAVLCAGTLIAGPSTSQSNSEPFEIYSWACESNPGEIQEHGRHLIFRNLYNTGPVYSPDPRLNGPLNVIVNIKLNTASNEGRFWGSLELLPSAYQGQGSWVGLFDARVPGKPTVVNGVQTHYTAVMVAHGTGVFDGLRIRFRHFVDPAIVTPPVDPPEGCIWEGEYWQGVIEAVP